jgi:hypothetical protein
MSARRVDYEGYLATLKIIRPHAGRMGVLALKALDAELALLPEGSPRFAFYRTAIGAMASSEAFAQGHPVLNALRTSLRQVTATQRRWLLGSLEAREQGLDQHLPTLQALDEYAQKTLVASIYCQLEYLLGPGNESAADLLRLEHSASHLGKAQFVSRRLRVLHQSLTRPAGKIAPSRLIPSFLLAKYRVSGEAIDCDPRSSSVHEALVSITHDLASHAHGHLSLFQKDLSSGSTSSSRRLASRLLKTEAFCTQRFLKRLEDPHQCAFDPLLNRRAFISGTQRDGFLPAILYAKSFLQ